MSVIINKNKETDNVLIFVHLPKTAGTTIYTIIDEQYKDYCDIRINGRNIFLSDLSMEQKKKIEVIRGHHAFGYFHKNLPQQNYTYITILRNPIEQIISHFYFIRSAKDHSKHDICSKISLYEFVTSKRFRFKNTNNQTRFLEGVNREDNLQKAKNNLLNHFSVVGITERFDETLYVLKKKLGWKIDRYEKKNITPNRPSVEEIPDEIIEIIKRKNQKDIKLYKFANKLLDKQLQQLKDQL